MIKQKPTQSGRRMKEGKKGMIVKSFMLMSMMIMKRRDEDVRKTPKIKLPLPPKKRNNKNTQSPQPCI